MTTALITAAVWTTLAVAACLAMHRARQARPTVAEPTEFVRWLPLLPPVPPPTTPPLTQTVASADWFWDVPSDCLSDDAIHSLCDDIERREFS